MQRCSLQINLSASEYIHNSSLYQKLAVQMPSFAGDNSYQWRLSLIAF